MLICLGTFSITATIIVLELLGPVTRSPCTEFFPAEVFFIVLAVSIALLAAISPILFKVLCRSRRYVHVILWILCVAVYGVCFWYALDFLNNNQTYHEGTLKIGAIHGVGRF